MFPIRDSIRPRRFPWVTVVLIAANLAAFVWQVQLGAALEPFVVRHAVVPARLTGALVTGGLPTQGLTIFTSMFLHGDLLHFCGNMWFLWIFGDNVEDRLGRLGFVAFYLACGAAAALSQVAFAPDSAVPMIGASGAIAGVLGAYLRLYPSARVLALVPIFLFIQFVEVPAVVFLGLWFALQILSSFVGSAGVAWWAHIAGFVAGLLLSLLASRPSSSPARPRPAGRVIRMRR